MSTKRRLLSREQRGASILRAAARAFAAGGFAATSMEDIAAEAGVTKLIVYRHFDSKQQLYEAVLDHTCEHLAEAVNVHGRQPALDMLRPLIAAARAEPEAFTLLFRHVAREPQFARWAVEFSERAADVAEQSLQPGIADPILRRWLARLLFSTTIEGILSWMELGNLAEDDMLADRLMRINAAMVQAVAPDAPTPP